MEKSKKDLLQEVIAHNRAQEKRARELNVRAGQVVFPLLTAEQWQEWLAARLDGASRAEEIVNFNAFRLPELDQELVELVLAENRDELEVLGRLRRVEYLNGQEPQMRIDFQDICGCAVWYELPDQGVSLPGGRLINLSIRGSDYYGSLIASGTSGALIKEQIKNHLNRRRWEEISDRPEIRPPEVSADEAIPEIVVFEYGKCCVTGEPLRAYGTVTTTSYSFSSHEMTLGVKWYGLRQEAERARNEAVERLEKYRSTKRKERALAAIALPDPSQEDAVVPEIVEIENGFGYVQTESSYYSSTKFSVQWTTDRVYAEKRRTEAAAKLAEVKAEEVKKRKLAEAQVAAEAARQALRDLSSREGWSDLDYALRREVDSRRYSYLPDSTEELIQHKADTEALIAKVEAALDELERRRKEEARAQGERQVRRAQGAKRLLALLSEHLATCPFCGQALVWDEEDCQRAAEHGSVGLSCRCYLEEALGNAIAGAEAGLADGGESFYYDGRQATVIRRLMVGGVPAIQFVLYYKYGQWNLAGVLDLDAAIADGGVEMVEVWHNPTETEIRLADLRQQAERYEADLAQARQDTADGYALRLRFRKGAHPRTGAEQWEAGSSKKGVKFIVDRFASMEVDDKHEFYCHERKTIVDTPRFKLIAVEPFLQIGRDFAAEIAALEAEAEAGENPAQAEAWAVAEAAPKEKPSAESLAALAAKFGR